MHAPNWPRGLVSVCIKIRQRLYRGLVSVNESLQGRKPAKNDVEVRILREGVELGNKDHLYRGLVSVCEEV